MRSMIETWSEYLEKVLDCTIYREHMVIIVQFSSHNLGDRNGVVLRISDGIRLMLEELLTQVFP